MQYAPACSILLLAALAGCRMQAADRAHEARCAGETGQCRVSEACEAIAGRTHRMLRQSADGAADSEGRRILMEEMILDLTIPEGMRDYRSDDTDR